MYIKYHCDSIVLSSNFIMLFSMDGLRDKWHVYLCKPFGIVFMGEYIYLHRTSENTLLYYIRHLVVSSLISTQKMSWSIRKLNSSLCICIIFIGLSYKSPYTTSNIHLNNYYNVQFLRLCSHFYCDWFFVVLGNPSFL